jgi:hypothetical protein
LIWILLLLSTNAYHQFTPPMAQEKLLEAYRKELKPKIEATNPEAAKYLEHLLTPSPRDASVTIANQAMWASGTAILAALICRLLPRRPDRHGADDVHEVEQPNPPRPKLDRLIGEYKELGLRAAQGRCLISYALLSFPAALFVRFGDSSSVSPQTLWHMGAIGIAAATAAIWSTQRPAIYFPDYPGLTMSFTIGFGGVFFGGLAALAIGLPYRMEIAGATAPLDSTTVQSIIALRLLVLPIVGWMASIVCVLGIRRYRGLAPNILNRPRRS